MKRYISAALTVASVLWLAASTVSALYIVALVLTGRLP